MGQSSIFAEIDRLCRYISRPAISEARLGITEGGKVRYELRTPFKSDAF
jgi:hypothetical protein